MSIARIKLARRLYVVGICLLLVYLSVVARGVLQSLNPAFQVDLLEALIDNGPIALLGIVLPHLAAFLNPDDEKLQKRVAWLARLSVLASLGFLLLIPLRAYNVFTLLDLAGNAQELRIDQASTRLNQLRDAVRAASSKQDLTSRLKALNMPALPPDLEDKPLPAIRANLNGSFDRMLAAQELRRKQSSQLTPVARVNQLFSNVRQMIASAIFAVAFAATGQQSKSQLSFLDDLLRGFGRRSKQLGKGNHADVKTHMNDYVRMIQTDQDPPAPPPP
jgi:hypothetical protein